MFLRTTLVMAVLSPSQNWILQPSGLGLALVVLKELVNLRRLQSHMRRRESSISSIWTSGGHIRLSLAPRQPLFDTLQVAPVSPGNYNTTKLPSDDSIWDSQLPTLQKCLLVLFDSKWPHPFHTSYE